MRDKEYAVMRVALLKAKLDWLLNVGGRYDNQKKINSTKEALRRWLRKFPDIDPVFLKTITRVK
jgi:hypothetical protein